jgi:hypothetical protein
VQRLRIDGLTVFRIAAEESTGVWVVVSGAEVVEAEVRVVLFAATTVPDTFPDRPNCKPIAVLELQRKCPGCGAGFQLRTP